MKVLFLVPRLDKASTRYRVLHYLPALKENGIDCEIRELSRRTRNPLAVMKQARRADVVVIQKKLLSRIELFFLRQASRRLVYDFDDAVMFKDGPASTSQLARQGNRFIRTVSQVDLVLAGNSYLADLARPYQKNVHILPTPLDMERYTAKPPKETAGNNVILGWIGSKGTLKYLADLIPALERLGKKHPDIVLKIVADAFFDLKNMEVIKKYWTAAAEIDDLHSFDIGIMPLTDDVWTRGKCGFKLLQCMAAGLPVVCSPVGMNREIVTDGVEGFWAQTAEEWVDRIGALATSHDLGREMGKKGRDKVRRHYSLAATTPLLLRALREA
ncbi:MAG: glycosyltransferase family 4 protein [Thermodesulfobacteriota bacterium]